MTDTDLELRVLDAATRAVHQYEREHRAAGTIPDAHHRGAAVAALAAATAVYDADQAAYIEQQVQQAAIAGWNMEGDGMHLRVVMARETAAGLVTAAKTFLDANPAAKNYIEQSVLDRATGDRYVLTIQRPGGRTPHELRQEAEMGRALVVKDQAFTMRVLRAFADIDLREELWWRFDDNTLTFAVICNDVFAWAVADAEAITPDNVAVLEQAIADIRAISDAVPDLFHAGSLFAARVRKQRPQGAAYPPNRALWPLFDACGPEREIDHGNPYPRGGKNADA